MCKEQSISDKKLLLILRDILNQIVFSHLPVISVNCIIHLVLPQFVIANE